MFLSIRWDLKLFNRIVDKVRCLKKRAGIKIAIPQDEFLNTDVLCDFIKEFNVEYVFSNALESEWDKIYSTVDFEKVKIFRVLTGYLDNKIISRINALSKFEKHRPIEIGYRAWRASPWLGRHGYLKAQIADVFNEKASESGLITDISTRDKDTLLGDVWYKYLLKCKYTIGVEGGASILDRNGEIRRKTEEYLRLNPNASFDEVENLCFPNYEGTLNLFAISPRHLEACATKTCQVLIEGSYNDILVAGKHYIELKRDFSNIEQVLNLIKLDNVREEITDRAYRDIVESGKYNYDKFVDFVIGQTLGYPENREITFRYSYWESAFFHLNRLLDIFSWVKVAVLFKIRRTIVKMLPDDVVTMLRKLR